MPTGRLEGAVMNEGSLHSSEQAKACSDSRGKKSQISKEAELGIQEEVNGKWGSHSSSFHAAEGEFQIS